MTSVLLALLVGSASATPTLNWVSAPARDGETVIASGGGFTKASVVTLTGSDGTKHNAKSLNVHESGISFQLPTGKVGGMSLYDVSVDGSAPIIVNAPDVWWWQGDSGNSSTPGGWLRVFGRSISAHSAEAATTAAVADRLEIDDAVSRADYAAARQLIDRLEMKRAPSGAVPIGTQLRLTPKSATSAISPVVISAVAANSSVFEARFELPATVAPGEYTAEISNGLKSPSKGEWFPLDMFIGSDGSYPVGAGHTGRLTTVTISKARVWSTKVFTVDCEWHKPIFERPCGWVGARDTGQLDAALAQAKAAGGGIVYLPRGQYYIDGPIIVPPNTRLRGAGQDLVAIYFREQQPSEAPMPGYIHANNSAAAWAVEDLAVYVSSFYHSVVYVGPSAVDFSLQRVRVRAAAYAMLDDRSCSKTCGESSRGNNISCLNDSCPNNKHRLANFSHMSSGEVVMLAGNSGYQITDCDLLGTAIIIHTGTHGASSGSPARYGYIARNVLWNANAGHWFDGIKEVIFEYNEIKPGGASPSWGNNIDTYAGGWAGHVWHAHNSFYSVWMNDREYMTFDGSQGVYFGPATMVAGSATVTLSDSAGTGQHAACATVLDGAGAGQYRKIIGWTKGSNQTNQTITLDKPFLTAVDETSTIQLGTCHMMILMHDNYYADGGAVQMIGDGKWQQAVIERVAGRIDQTVSWF